ncbi:hypothetical protein PIB30_083827, partial [Stylosanthes scabra]|nr:hypothetical protein [Stylosanthes scabra]
GLHKKQRTFKATKRRSNQQNEESSKRDQNNNGLRVSLNPKTFMHSHAHHARRNPHSCTLQTLGRSQRHGAFLTSFTT